MCLLIYEKLNFVVVIIVLLCIDSHAEPSRLHGIIHGLRDGRRECFCGLYSSGSDIHDAGEFRESKHGSITWTVAYSDATPPREKTLAVENVAVHFLHTYHNVIFSPLFFFFVLFVLFVVVVIIDCNTIPILVIAIDRQSHEISCIRHSFSRRCIDDRSVTRRRGCSRH